MILVYILFALTLSAVLMAVFDAEIPEQVRSEAFIAIFAALMLVAWSVDAWLLPYVAMKGAAPWVPVVAVCIFGAILAVSAVLSTRSESTLMRGGAHHGVKRDVEAIGFDFVLLVLMAVFGIMVLGIAMLK